MAVSCSCRPETPPAVLTSLNSASIPRRISIPRSWLVPCSGALMPTLIGLVSGATQAMVVPAVVAKVPHSMPPVQSASVVQENVVPARLGPEQPVSPAARTSAPAENSKEDSKVEREAPLMGFISEPPLHEQLGPVAAAAGHRRHAERDGAARRPFGAVVA